MDKQKQIEEIQRYIDLNVFTYKDDEKIYGTKGAAEVLHNKGYRKIPEGAIILTKEEIAALNEYQIKHFIGSEPNEE